ncbi:DEAD/DEAH box helicase [Lysobacter sp. SG-8]|uniref:ATP-dependent RNA helicase DeaD n=1 Tax=Marilutibacter penaei TaxID=2759900 RepID=A0A7W3U2C1_9GAMM|nr:DEAD/DEAH box helicase [Lysobacter penaei]MBB1087609.1 DEAD/DEAH box helicase [Lysobacter penaei]
MSDDTPVPGFDALGLPEPLLRALSAVGYESPSPIQAATIPPLLEGRDLLGQAQTGTGKTAAFALPVLARAQPGQKKPRALVLAPTRELAIQVAEAFQKYANHLPGFHVLPIYGGQSYHPQLAALRRGVDVVVGTPGRVIDHLERGSLDLSELECLVLDEADEMLRMGFIDDVEAVLKKTPETRQVALFSATMPAPIKRIAQTYLREPVEIAIQARTTTSDNIRQRYWWVSGVHKLDALTRILEAEPFDAMIIFARTKQATEELAEKLTARGFAAAAINGDVQQQQRERTVQQLKDGRIDVLVATDVAARGLDVERISHVLNYDIPYDTESYVHRIGRTGRAGRSGDAILFVTPRERGMLRAIERATRQTIEQMELPSIDTVNEQRVNKFLGRIGESLERADLPMFRDLVERYEREKNVPMAEIAAALACLVQGEQPLLLDKPKEKPRAERPERGDRPRGEFDRAPRNRGESMFDDAAPRGRATHTPDAGMETFRIEVGHRHGVKPGNIVGAIANEAELESRYIGRIDIQQEYSFVDLPEGMPRELMEHLKKVRVAGQPLRISRPGDMREAGADARDGRPPRRPHPGKPGHKPRHAGPKKPHRGR